MRMKSAWEVFSEVVRKSEAADQPSAVETTRLNFREREALRELAETGPSGLLLAPWMADTLEAAGFIEQLPAIRLELIRWQVTDAYLAEIESVTTIDLTNTPVLRELLGIA